MHSYLSDVKRQQRDKTDKILMEYNQSLINLRNVILYMACHTLSDRWSAAISYIHCAPLNHGGRSYTHAVGFHLVAVGIVRVAI